MELFLFRWKKEIATELRKASNYRRAYLRKCVHPSESELPNYIASAGLQPKLPICKMTTRFRGMTISSVLVLTIIVTQTIFASGETAVTLPQHDCRIDLNRFVISQNRQVWVCRCIDDQGNENALGRVEQNLEAFQNTMGHEHAILRCQRRNQNRLLEACRAGTEQYQRIATTIIETCVATTLNRAEKAMNQPFSFNTDRCGARFVRFISPRTGGVWICECVQEIQTERAYFVVSGRSAFLTDSSPLGAEEEVGVLRTCTTNAALRIDRVCRITPGDFQLLSLQMLEVCCKRARVNSEQKFQCKTAVPDDISPLKIPFLM